MDGSRSCAWLILLIALTLTAGCGGSPSDPPAAGDAAEAAPDETPGEGLDPEGEDPQGQEAVEPLQNTIRWSTASEVDSYGFDIYRATSEDGPFEVINDKPIPGAGTVDVPQQYEYFDRSIEPDTAYWYYVESIAIDGQRETITPLAKAGPKPAPRPGD